MRSIIVTSTKPYTGKSGIAVALAQVFADRGLDVGYFKPYGTMPVLVDDLTTDEDALYVNQTLVRPSDIADVCPVVRTQGLIERVLGGSNPDMETTVLEAWRRCADGRDVMIIEGPTEPGQGVCTGLSLTDVATLFDAPVLLIDRPRSTDLPEDAVWASRIIGDRLAGLLMNGVHEARLPVTRDRIMPFLESRGVPALGVIPYDPGLGSVTIQEIVDALDAVVLTAPDRLENTVEAFMVGAMGQEKALRFFRRKANKAVITGGDRADVQLAALETSTRCIVLTGNLLPDPFVVTRAEESGVPMLMVDTDTLTAVERMDTLLGRVHLHDPVKAARIRAMLERECDLERLLRAMQLD
ncbi:MAG: phosphotransacetylase family protein [Coriobacteriia bacterium]|nr:phosphotransacetylase family protein [Coriobacteriia bacterium]